MEGVGSPSDQNSRSFLPHLLISAGGITATALAIVGYHLIAKYITKRRLQRSTVSGSQTLQFIALGIEEKVLQTIPILPYSTKDCNNNNDNKKLFRVDQSECVICLGDLEDGEMVRLLPNCRHAFHVPCIGNWFLGHDTCPFCRSPVIVSEKPKSTPGKSSALPVSDDDVTIRNDDGERFHRSASGSRLEYLLIMPIEEKQRLLASTLKRSFSIGECFNLVPPAVCVQNDDEMCRHDVHRSCSSSSSTRILRESRSFTARSSVKQIDHRMSSRAVRSFSQLRILGSRSCSRHTTSANSILPY